VAPPEKRAAVQRALSEAGAMVLDCNIARTGVTVSSE